MKKILIVILAIYFVGGFYLVLPEPVIPNLPHSLKSTEPGDTWQIPGAWAYYTNLSRREAVDFYQKSFSRSPFLGIPFPTYILNHPPEYAQETIRDTQQTNFYEELVHPLRESLFISGLVPSEVTVYLASSREPATEFLVEDKHWMAKITLYHVQSSIWARLLVWTGIMGVAAGLVYFSGNIVGSPWRRKK